MELLSRFSHDTSQDLYRPAARDRFYQRIAYALQVDDYKSIEDLPEEVMLAIFAQLHFEDLERCAQVCEYWNQLTLDKSLLKCIDLSHFSITEDHFQSILQRSKHFLLRLSLIDTDIEDSSFKTLAELCPNIEDLYLNDCLNITDNAVLYVSQGCTKLQKLNFDSCYEITDKSLGALSVGCKNLTHIDVSNCPNITEEGLEMFSKNCSKIRSFICSFLDIETLNFVKNWPSLEVINVNSCDRLYDLEALAQYCPKLTDISITCCESVNDNNLIGPTQHWLKLKRLNLSNNRITDIIELIQDCKNLEEINLQFTFITEITLNALITEYPRLKTINCGCCKKIEAKDETILSMAKHSSQLEKVYLSFCKGINDNHIQVLARHCPNLTSLDINCCRLTDSSLTALATYCRKLTKIDASSNYLFTVEGFKALFEGCLLLKHVYLVDTNVSDASLKCLAMNCAKLQTLIVKSKHITDQGVKELTMYQSAKSLRIIFVDCGNLTENALKYLIGCSNLKELRVPKQARTAEAERFLKVHLPGIKIFK